MTGAARYTADIRLPGMLYARMVNAKVPHAKVLSIDTSAAERYPGVKAVYVIEHIDGNAELSDKSKEIPSKYPIVRYAGQPIGGRGCCFAADCGRRRIKLVKVEYQEFPFVIDRKVAEAIRCSGSVSGAGRPGGNRRRRRRPKNVQQVGNVHGPSEKRVGYVKEGFADADVRLTAIHHAGANPFGARNAWRCRRLEAGRADGVRLNPEHIQCA